MRDKSRTSEFFDRYAHDFSAIYGTSNTPWNRLINALFRKSMMTRYRKTLEGCEPIKDRTVLDIGCGPGHYSVALAEKGARRVVGIDFAPAMIELARSRATEAGVAEICDFVCDDFTTYEFGQTFDYSIAMGFMDYVAKPEDVVTKVASLTTSRAFFSFPAAGGFLAWQRKLRYRRRCDLFLYRLSDIRSLFERCALRNVVIERIARDFFVTVVFDQD